MYAGSVLEVICGKLMEENSSLFLGRNPMKHRKVHMIYMAAGNSRRFQGNKLFIYYKWKSVVSLWAGDINRSTEKLSGYNTYCSCAGMGNL